MPAAANAYVDFYQQNNINIIPIDAGAKHPISPWDKYKGMKFEDPASLKEHKGNFFVICGNISDNLHVLDIETWDVYEKYFKDVNSYTIKTPSGGVHIYYKFADDINRIPSVNGWPVEIRGNKHGVVSAGSTYNDKSYEIIKDVSIIAEDLGELAFDRLQKLNEDRVNDIQSWKKKISISEVIEQTVTKDVELKDCWKGLCPFHTESNPSLAVYESNYYCFGCEEHGDVIDWVMKRDSISFADAVKKLSEQFEIPMPKLRGSVSDRMSLDQAKDVVKDLADKCKADQRAIMQPEILEALAVIRKESPIDFDIITKPITKDGIGKRSIESELDKIDSKWSLEASSLIEPDEEVASPQIHAEAMDILQKGDPLQYIADSCGCDVVGTEKASKKLACMVQAQNIKQTAGLHPKLNGESGMGKSFLVYVFAHHLPPEMVNEGSMSAKAAFYHKFKDRSFNLLDDYREGGNPDLDTVIKQTSTKYHKHYKHRTVIDGEPAVLEVGSEQLWAITSVDSSQDIQLLNRQDQINVDESETMTQKINAHTLDRYGNGLEQYKETERVLICREMFRICRNADYINVKIPFRDRIEWLDNSSRRNLSIFLDYVVAITGWFRFQREQDAEGYYLAEESDFKYALSLFADKEATSLVQKLTPKEKDMADLLARTPSGLTTEELTSKLQIKKSRLSTLVKGLAQKLTGFQVTEISDMRDTEKGKRTIRSNLYKLEGYSAVSGFESIVRLKPSSSQSADIGFVSSLH